RLIAAPIMGRAIPIGAAAPVAVVIIPVVVVRPMEALQGKAIPEAPGLGRLRCRDANQQGDGGKGAKNESHRVTSFPNLGKETTRWPRTIPRNPTDEQHGMEETVGQPRLTC